MNKAEEFWDKIAELYEKKEARFEKIHLETIENTKKFLETSNVVLDYGCATGSKAFGLSGHVKNILGIDISSKMIERAKRKAAEGKVENVDFLHTTIFDEILRKESFDVVLAFNILHALKEKRQAVERIAQLLRPGGLFISTTPCLKEKMDFLNYLQFSFYFFLIKLGILPNIISRFKIPDLEDIVKTKEFAIIKTEKLYHQGMSYFIVAKKKTDPSSQ
jgi:2-polyprenyl-3-methyl-5-hydroxy-6-metoxy-1,4-benzoquinol methylase